MRRRVFVQIGTNNGDDRYRQDVIREKPDLVVLVEPNSALRDAIVENYKDIPNTHIITAALYYTDNEEVTLYIPGMRSYSDAHYSLLPMNDWGEKDTMEKIRAPSITFDTLCKRFDIDEIDFLQIDTEGFDSEIIQMIDLEKVKIHKIRYEIWGFSPAEFTRHHGDKYARLGKAGLDAATQKLLNHGYSVVRSEDQNDLIATLNM